MTRRAWLGAGAAIAASAVAGVVGLNVMSQHSAPVTYDAPKGQTRLVVLADGSHVHLNGGSTITVSMDRDARRVTMDNAEAAFDVTHDPRRPFLIAVGDREVRVVGTEFNLRRRRGTLALTVRRGIVEVHEAGKSPATRLVRGQQLIHQDGAAGSLVRVVEPDAAFAWKDGQLIYRDQPLSEVADDLSDRFETPVRVDGGRASQLRFTGVLVADNEAAVLRRLEAFLPIRAERTATDIVLRARSPRG